MGSKIIQAEDGFDVTPDDDNDIVPAPAIIYVGTAGDVEVVTQGGTTLTFSNWPAGVVLPILVKRVRAANTTALNIIALR